MNDRYREQRAEWVKTDPNIPAAQWSAEQRAVTMAVVPVMQQQAAELRRLADKTADPTLRSMLELEAAYQDAFANQLPTYSPEDKRLWVAATDFGNAVNSLCHATSRR